MRDDGIRSACTDKRNNNNNSTLNACMPYGLFLANEPSQMKSQLSHLYSEHKYNGAFNSFLQNNRDTWNICFDNNNFSSFIWIFIHLFRTLNTYQYLLAVSMISRYLFGAGNHANSVSISLPIKFNSQIVFETPF